MLLLGGLAVSVPIALHFFYKARYRPLPWAAMNFLRVSIEQTSRRVKFQEYVLLALRCLALLLLALALARLTVSWGGGGRGESVDAVLVFDTSYSMAAKDGEKTRFARAQDAALGVIDNLPANSTVRVITCAGGQATRADFTPTNLDQARTVVAQLTTTSQAGDILPGLADADTVLDQTQGTNKEVYVFSDLQKTDWERQAAAVKAKAEELRGRGPFVLVRCGNPETSIKNVAITDITFPGGIPRTGTRMPFTVLLKNTGKEPIQNVAVTLEVDGRRDDIDTGLAAEIPPGGLAAVTLTAKLSRPGVRLLTAKVGEPAENAAPGQPALSGNQPDDLPGDNRFDKLIPVRDKIRVLLVDGSPSPRDPVESAGHYIGNALVPVLDLQKDDYHVKVTEVTADLATPALLGDADLVVLANVPASNADRPGLPGLSSEFVTRLKTFVADGGGLLIGVGDLIVPTGYNAVLGSGGAGLLPFDFTEMRTAPNDAPFHPAPDTTETPSFLSKLREHPYSTLTALVSVTKAVDVSEADRATGGRVMLRMTNDKPLISAKTVGSGEVIVVHTTLDAKWTDWPGQYASSFVSVVRFTLSHLTARVTRGANRVAGETLVYFPTDTAKPGEFDPAKPFELVPPTGLRVLLGKATPGATDKKLTVTTDKTAEAGEYHIVAEGSSPGTGGRFAVVPDLKESENLECLTDGQVSAALGFSPAIVAAVDPDAVGQQRNKREWTVWILLALFFVACGEAAWAWHCGRAK
jgi:hypothetical protein